MKVLELSDLEKRTVLNWYEHTLEDSSHFGQAQYVFPEEERLISKIKKSKSDKVKLCDFEIKIIFNWMEKSMLSKFGPAVYLLPGEESVFEKIKYLIQKIEEEEKNESEAREEQEREETLAGLEIEKLTLRLEAALKKVSEIKKIIAEKKDRSIDDKISADD